MNVVDTSARQSARFERKREAILEAAAELFNARGLNGATIADVAQSVGLTTTSVTYYYRRKEDLAAACVMRSIEALNTIAAAAEQAGDGPDRFRQFTHSYFALQAEIVAKRCATYINFWDLRAMTGTGAEVAGAAFSDLFRRLRRWFKDSPGLVLSRAEQNARTHLMFSAVLWAKEWIAGFDVEDYPRVADAFADVMIGGLAGPGAAWMPAVLDEAAPRSAMPEVSREAFLRAATELVNEHGYRGASVDRISAKLSVTKGSFYHHNENKSDLVAECFAHSFEVIRAAHRAAPRTLGSGWLRLCTVAATLVRHQRSERGPLLRYSALSAMPANTRPGLILAFDRLAQRTAGIIVDGIADGSIRPVDPTVAALVMTGMINAAAELHHWVHDCDEGLAVELFVRPSVTGMFAPVR